MSGSDGLAGLTGARWKTAHCHVRSSSSARSSAQEPYLCYLQADQRQSQSPEASVWNEKYVCLRNKERNIVGEKTERQIECAQMCLGPLSNMDAVWVGRRGDTVSAFQSKLRPPAFESPILIPIMESCRCELRCRGPADLIISCPARAEPPLRDGNFSSVTFWLGIPQPSSTSQSKEITPQ